jgi:hypothetical protein
LHHRFAVKSNGGAALVIALLAMCLFMALGLALVLNTATDVMIADHFQAAEEAFYAADAGLERSISELSSVADWNPVLQGLEHSSFVDGSLSAARVLSDGSTIDLSRATNVLNCRHAGSCTPAEMDALTADRPWGLNNPRWTLYAHGPLAAIAASGTINSSMYVAVWVGDDQSDNDNDPTTDGADESNPGRGLIVVHSEAFGPGGAHKVVEATIGRGEPADRIRVMAWRRIN